MCTIESLEANLLQQRKSLSANKVSSGNLLNCSTSTIDFEDSEPLCLEERDVNSSLFSSELFSQVRKSSSSCASLHGKVMNTRKISGASSITFIDKASWKKEFNCYICNVGVDKRGMSRHHCRLCGGSVCGGCSDRVVNSQRTCDMCFYKLKSEADIIKRDHLLTNKEGTIENLKITFSKKIEKLKVERAKTLDQQRICKQADEQEREIQGQLVAQKIEAEEGLSRVQELHDCLSSSVKKNKQIILEKESKLQKLRNNLESLKSIVFEQKKLEENKKTELQNLSATYKSLSEEKMKIESQKASSCLSPPTVTV